jgi:hypothetical protein
MKQIYTVVLAITSIFAASASAGTLTLNATGIADGFSLSTVVTGLPVADGFRGTGVSSVASTSNGNLLVADVLGKIYLFSDKDGQTVSDALSVASAFTPSSPNTPGGTPALVNSGGTVYLGVDRQLFSLKNDGSVNSLLLNGALVTSGGLAANPVTGILYSNSNIDPDHNLTVINAQTNSYALYPAGGGNVGAVSLDGSTLYLSHYPNLFAFDTTTFGVEWVSSTYSGTVGRIQNGPHAGDLIGYDSNLGNLVLFDKNNGHATIIGTGGSTAGQNVGVDSTNGTLFLPLGDTVLRISSVPPTVSSFVDIAGGILNPLFSGNIGSCPTNWICDGSPLPGFASYSPTSTQYPSGPQFPTSAFSPTVLGGSGSIRQNTSLTWIAGDTYFLNLWAGLPSTEPNGTTLVQGWPTARLYLTFGFGYGQVAAFDIPRPPFGSFASNPISFTLPAGSPFAGKTIGVLIFVSAPNNFSANFDITPSVIPTPNAGVK